MNLANKHLPVLTLLVSLASAPACSPQSADQLLATIQAPAQSFSGFSVELLGSAIGARPGGKPGYEWTLVQKPNGSEASIADRSSERASLTPDRPGQYTIRLSVRQEKTAGRPTEVILQATPWFAEVTNAPRAPGPVPPVGTAWGDYNNDGRPDLYVSSLETPHTLYADSGDGRYADTTAAALGPAERTTGGAWGDFDNDGRLDLAVAKQNEAADSVRVSGTVDASLTLYRNLGDGRFADVSSHVGVRRDLSESAKRADSDSWQCRRPGQPAWLDFDTDRRMDLFVACENGAGRSVLYRNLGGEGFKDVTREAGLETSRGSGIAVGDYDNDGDPDLFVYGAGSDRLWENNGDGTFSDVTAAAEIVGHAGPSAAAVFFDLDNDGDLDIYAGGVEGVLFINAGNRMFSNATSVSGLGDGNPAQKATSEDVDDDGDPDLILLDASGKERFFRNNLADHLGNNWLRVSLEGTQSNRFGVGARVEVTTTEGTSRTAWPTGDPSSRVRDPMALHFGLGKTDWANVRVTWPSGIVQDFWFLRPNRTFWAREKVLEGW